MRGLLAENIDQPFEIQDCEFLGFNGGAVHVLGATYALSFSRVHFAQNNASTKNAGGGAIYIESCASVLISDAVFIENRAKSGRAAHGGAVYISSERFSSVVSMIDSFFESNSAGHGGAIYCQRSSVLRVHASTFTGNVGLQGAGTLSITAASTTLKYVAVESSRTKTAAITCTASSLTVANSMIARTRGGGRAVRGAYCEAMFSTCNIFENGWGNDGGGGMVFRTLSEIIVSSSNFTNNVAATADGGAIYCMSCKSLLIVNGSQFRGEQRAARRGRLRGKDTADVARERHVGRI